MMSDNKMSAVWTPNDYSNIITIGAAAIGSVMLILFKSRCSKISLCWGLWSCDRDVTADEDEEAPKTAGEPTENA